MQCSEKKDIKIFCEVIAECVFRHRSGSRKRGNAWQNVVTTLSPVEGFRKIGRTVRDMVAYLIRKFSARNNTEKKLPDQCHE